MSERLRCLSSLPPTAVHWRSAFTGLLLESASSLARSSLVLLLFICLFIYDCQAAFFRVCVCVCEAVPRPCGVAPPASEWFLKFVTFLVS